MTDVRTRPRTRGWSRLALRVIVTVYLGMLVAWPVSLVFWNTFADGVGPVLQTFADPVVINALRLTLIATAWSVGLNVVFGVGLSIILVRYEFPGKRVLNALVDLPLAVSPVVVGLAIVLLYRSDGWLGAPLGALGIRVLFSTPALVLATTFVAMPLVVREVVPVLHEIGTDQEVAARSLGAGTWQTFRRITLPAIRWGVVYGASLCLARSLGEFGAVKIVSGNVVGRTQTATLVVEQLYFDFDAEGAFAIASLLALISIAVIVAVGIARTSVGRAAEVKGQS